MSRFQDQVSSLSQAIDQKSAKLYALLELFTASTGNRTRGWPTLSEDDLLMATANFTTKPSMLCMKRRGHQQVLGGCVEGRGVVIGGTCVSSSLAEVTPGYSAIPGVAIGT